MGHRFSSVFYGRYVFERGGGGRDQKQLFLPMTTSVLLDRIASILPLSFLLGTAIGAFTYAISYRLSPILLASHYVTPAFARRVSSLDVARGYNLHACLPSTVHAIIQVVGTYSFVFSRRNIHDAEYVLGADNIVDDPTYFDDRIIVPYGITHLGPAVYMGIFVGYLLADLYAMPSPRALGYALIVHHVAASACWTYCAHQGVMQRIGCHFQFNEVSTPLMNVRQYLLTAGYRSDDAIVSTTGLAFFVVFGLARVVPLPIVVRDWIDGDYVTIREKVGTGGAVLLTIFFVVNAALQCGWFYVMCRKVTGTMMVGKKSKGGGKRIRTRRREGGGHEEEGEKER